MYGLSLLNVLAPFLLLGAIVALASWLNLGGSPEERFAVSAWIYLAVTFILVPVFADSLYYRALRVRGDKARSPSSWTFTGALLLGILGVLLVIAVAVPAYSGYAPRAKVSEGVSIAASLRAPIAEFHAKHQRLPGPEEAKKFSYGEPMHYTALVAWDAARKAIVVTMADRFQGKRFEIAAEEKGGTLEWTCRTIDLEPKYLPASCR
jgi:Tfp pilus assembly protein PilE